MAGQTRKGDGDNLTIGVFYTVVSFARSYLLRRFYNRLLT